MRARLQTDIEGTFSEQSPVSHRVYGDDFGMGHAGTVVVALTDDTPMSHKDCSDKRIGRGEPFGILWNPTNMASCIIRLWCTKRVVRGVLSLTGGVEASSRSASMNPSLLSAHLSVT